MTVRVGALGYSTSQGLSHIMRDFYNAGVVTEPLLFRHSSRRTHNEWYPEGTLELVNRPFNGPTVDAYLKKIDVLLFFETPFDWGFINYARERGVKTALIPMYEWTPIHLPAKPDIMICPSALDRDYFPGNPFIPIPVPQDIWQPRTTAKRFLHNAGNIGHREHKGTRELIKAVRYVKSPFKLTIRAQDVAALKRLLKEEPDVVKDRRVRIEYGEIPYEELWQNHDVLIAPEKFNGLSLPLQEGRAAGMFVMTSDRYPHNTWLPREGLIPVAGYHKARIAGSYLEFDEAEVNPRDIAKTIDAWYGKDISSYSQSAVEWNKTMSWEVLKPQYMEVFESLVKP